MLRSFAAVLFLSALPVTSLAATIDFTRTETSGWVETSRLQGLTLEGAVEVDGQVQRGGAKVGHWRFGGLGLKGSTDSGELDGTDQFDSYGDNDVVVLKFDRTVRLDRISFSMTDFFDRFDLYVGEALTFDRTHKVDDFRGYD